MKAYIKIGVVMLAFMADGLHLHAQQVLNNQRTEIHDELCILFNLSKEVTKSITDNIDMNNNRVAENLYLVLLDKSREVIN
jgi:hypothetical protein